MAERLMAEMTDRLRAQYEAYPYPRRDPARSPSTSSASRPKPIAYDASGLEPSKFEIP